MLGIERQRANETGIEPGGDPGVFEGQPRNLLRGPDARRGLRLGEPDVAAAQLQRTGAERSRRDSALPREDDGAKPAPRDAPGHAGLERGRSAAEELSALSPRNDLHPSAESR